MSSSIFDAPLRLELRPSRRLRLWRWLVHGAAAATLPMLQSFPLAAVVTLLLLTSFFRRTPTPSTLLWRSDGCWECNIEGRAESAALATAAYVQPWSVILPLRCEGRRRIRYVVLLSDMLPAQTFRRLRVRLRNAIPDDIADMERGPGKLL